MPTKGKARSGFCKVLPPVFVCCGIDASVLIDGNSELFCVLSLEDESAENSFNFEA